MKHQIIDAINNSRDRTEAVTAVSKILDEQKPVGYLVPAFKQYTFMNYPLPEWFDKAIHGVRTLYELGDKS